MEEDQRTGRENDPSPHSPQCSCSGVPCGGPYKEGAIDPDLGKGIEPPHKTLPNFDIEHLRDISASPSIERQRERDRSQVGEPGKTYRCGPHGEAIEVKEPEEELNPDAPNMKRLLELVGHRVDQEVTRLMEYYGISAKDLDSLPEPEAGDKLTHEHVVQLDLSGPHPKIYTSNDQGINWKEAERENPIVGAFIERLKKQPGTLEVIGLPEKGDEIPEEVMKRIERIGMAMADKLGKDGFEIVTIIEDKDGNQRVKRAEYLRRGDKKKDKVKELIKTAKARREAVKVLTRPAIKTAAKTKKRNLNFREIEPVENRRVYVFPGNHRVIVENTCRIAVMDSGIHRLETTTGQKHIIPAGWLQVIIDAKEWAF